MRVNELLKNTERRKQFFEPLEVVPDILESLYQVDGIENLYNEHTAEIKLFNAELEILSERERYCYAAHAVESKSYSAIAKELGITKGAVQMYIRRARKKLNET